MDMALVVPIDCLGTSRASTEDTDMAMQEFTQEMKNLMSDTIRDVHTALPGKIVSFDPAKCEATVLPSGKFKKPDGSMMDFPQIFGVPIMFLQSAGQTATIAYPVRANDQCSIFFAEQALDTWKTDSESDTDLRFDLTNAFAVVGLFAKANPLVQEACDNDALIVEKDGERVLLKNGTINIQCSGSVSISAPIINLN